MGEEVAMTEQVVPAEEAPPLSVDEARLDVRAAREAAGYEIDELIAAARAAVDIPARIRREPLKAAGLAGGAAFLLLRGPRRVGRGVERRLFPGRAERRSAVLPKEIERTLDRLGDGGDRVRAHLERDFVRYLERGHPADAPNSRRSFWRTYDIAVGILGAVAGRILIRRLVDGPPDRPRTAPPASVQPTPAEQLDAIDSAAGRVVER